MECSAYYYYYYYYYTYYYFTDRVPIIVSLLSVCILLFFVSSLGLSYSSSMSVTDYTNEVIGTIGEYVCRNIRVMIPSSLSRSHQ